MNAGPPESGLAGRTDEALVAAVAERADRDAFAELFRRYAGRVKAMLMRSGAAADVAEEVAQEVMVAVWRKASTFDADKASVATWIYTIARNRRVDLIRRTKRPEPDPDDPLFRPDPAPPPDAAMAAAQRDLRIRQALHALPPDQLEVVRLAFFAGLSHGEIAERLGAPLGTVKSRLRLSFARLRARLGGDKSEL